MSDRGKPPNLLGYFKEKELANLLDDSSRGWAEYPADLPQGGSRRSKLISKTGEVLVFDRTWKRPFFTPGVLYSSVEAYLYETEDLQTVWSIGHLFADVYGRPNDLRNELSAALAFFGAKASEREDVWLSKIHKWWKPRFNKSKDRDDEEELESALRPAIVAFGEVILRRLGEDASWKIEVEKKAWPNSPAVEDYHPGIEFRGRFAELGRDIASYLSAEGARDLVGYHPRGHARYVVDTLSRVRPLGAT